MAETYAQPTESLTELEVHSIDYIPEEERHGRVRDQFTLWFAATMNVFNIVLGAIAVEITGNFWWAIFAFSLGTVLGLMLVGFHAMQGPRLGVPQMIQSRGQFGFYGAVLVFAASIVLDVGYLAAQLVIQAQAMNILVSGISIPAWIAILCVPVIALALYGYDWVHRWQRWMTLVLGITFVIVFIQALSYGSLPHSATSSGAPSFALFMGVLALAGTNMLSWAPYVSDYSRYLPKNVNPRQTFWAVMAGNAIPTIFAGLIGAYLASLLPKLAGDSVPLAIQHVSGRWALIIMAASLVGSDVVNVYTGMIALASIASCFTEVRDKLSTRVVGVVLLLGAGLIVALFGYKSFVNNLSEFLGVLLFVFIPWSVINLVDFYYVKHGDYDVASFFTPRGKYPGFIWKGLIPYALAVGCEIPFISQEFYTGPLVKSLGGVDISWFVGAIVAFILYMIALRIPLSTHVGSSGDVAATPDVTPAGKTIVG
jgi:nucleobase:cation symporter-1, NCS1 family